MPPGRMLLWSRANKISSRQHCVPFSGRSVIAILTVMVFMLLFVTLAPVSMCRNKESSLLPLRLLHVQQFNIMHNVKEFDCIQCQQAAPVVANKVEGVRHPFFISLADLGSPEKPNRNFLRMLKGKSFRKPDISQTIQDVLEKLELEGLASKHETVVDVGANVGMAAFAAAAMGYKVLAFEAVFENLQKLCDGLYLNRAAGLIRFFHAAVSDISGNLTMHKLVGRLDNSAVSATGAKLAFKNNEIVPVTVRSVTLDDMIPDSEPVLLLKIDVQGWEYHVLKGAYGLLSREPSHAPYIIYEDDEKLLKESNTTSKDIKDFLTSVGYNSCTRHDTDTHCRKLKVN
eukprot:TRINITY_DN7623_c0_g1_i1.p1 TRINITY_DN7623_c0_g1~~TRINITY_DN7623_c0_g1_i1.p1  ORF type:complete len:343 (+),score=66.62 TRINITY_DN7623_c0_g1_i1:361-1389(+)